MKLSSHKVERNGDKLTVRASLKTHMRQPCNVTITMKSGENYVEDEPVMTGDVRDVSGTLNALAEIAWEQGWRPRGLMGTVARIVETYKEPPVSAGG